MNTTKRFIFGALASLLLAVGFANAADRLDPMSRSVGTTVGVTDDDPPPGPPCDEGGGGEP
jgi:ABC-type amino acid transport substrate-binding protein